MSQPQASPASMAQAVAPQMPAYQAPAQAAQASAPQGNPWQQAFQALSASLNTSSPSQAQVSPSAYQSDANTASSYTAELGFNGTTGSPDLQSPSFNPGLTRNRKSASWCSKRRSRGRLRHRTRISAESATQVLKFLSTSVLKLLLFSTSTPVLLKML